MAIETSQFFITSLNYMAMTIFNRVIDLQIRISQMAFLEIFKGAANHYLNKCWLSSMTPYCITRLKFIKIITIQATFSLPFEFGNWLAEVNVDASIIYEYIIHLEVGVLTLWGLEHNQQQALTQWEQPSKRPPLKGTTPLRWS